MNYLFSHFFIIQLLLIHQIIIKGNFIYFSLTKNLYIPGKSWSAVNITHQLNQLTPQIYDFKAQLSLTQSTEFDQTSSFFDFFILDADVDSKFSQFNTCYQNAVSYMNILYQQYQPCQQICQFSQTNKKLRRNQYKRVIASNQLNSSSMYFIVDNTYYPCQNGTYQPQLYLFQEISLKIQTNSQFFILLEVGCVVFLQILIMLITYIMIMFNKLHERKTKLLKIRQQEDNKDVLKNFLYSKSRD